MEASNYLFPDFAPKPVEKPVKVVSTPKREKETASVAPKVDISRYPKPKKHYTYDEYRKIFRYNSAAAEYWWKKDMQRLEEEQKCGHTA
jgi:hypothetical protein